MNNNTKNEIEVKQVNPKLRLFLLIFCNWLWFLLLIFIGGGWASWSFKVPFFQNHMYIIWISFGCFLLLTFFNLYIGRRIGVKYLPKDLRQFYFKNNNQLEKINNLEITNVTQLFSVIPICQEVYSEDPKTKLSKFINLSWIDKSKNRLVVNGKINSFDFSWGIVAKMKRNNFKNFLLAVLYFGPVVGVFTWFLMLITFNAVNLSEINQKDGEAKYKKFGCFDLFVKKTGIVNSENYLIFSAKLQSQNNSTVLIPNKNQYQWPTSLTAMQKKKLEDLIQELEYLPSIYIFQDNISIIMKKYDYNKKDENELETWELLRQENANNEINFNYLNNAIKIYQIFNETNSN